MENRGRVIQCSRNLRDLLQVFIQPEMLIGTLSDGLPARNAGAQIGLEFIIPVFFRYSGVPET
jgi:hypothetical protein